MFTKFVVNGYTQTLCKIETSGVCDWSRLSCIPKAHRSQRALLAAQAPPSAFNERSIRGQHSSRALTDLPTRSQELENLQKCVYDVLVIGGGVTGAGCALDAATRGLKTALVDANDFASGASSKSIKIINGSALQLHQALCHFNMARIQQVRSILRERATIKNIAPHLNRPLPVVVPIYNSLQRPFYWLVLKSYDLAVGSSKVHRTRYISPRQAMCTFPLLNEHHLSGAFIYFDEVCDNSRLGISIALTASQYGASICNYMEVVGMEPHASPNNRVVNVQDKLTGQLCNITAKCIVNATGVSGDLLRRLDSSSAEPITERSAGTHVALPGYLCSRRYGLYDPLTDDGRMVYMMPWKGYTLAGTMDEPCSSKPLPKPTKDEVDFILACLQAQMNNRFKVSQRHVLSAWKSFSHSVLSTEMQDDADDDLLPDTHLLEVSPNRMISIVGGTAATYRAKAVETVQLAIDYCDLPAKNKSMTASVPVAGSENWTPHFAVELVQLCNIPMDVARHLSECYGTNAYLVVNAFERHLERLDPRYPFIEAEVHYACVFEYAMTLVDVIARRLRIAYIDVNACMRMLPTILKIMASRRYWSEKEARQQLALATEFLNNELGIAETVQEHEQMAEHSQSAEVAAKPKVLKEVENPARK